MRTFPRRVFTLETRCCWGAFQKPLSGGECAHCANMCSLANVSVHTSLPVMDATRLDSTGGQMDDVVFSTC